MNYKDDQFDYVLKVILVGDQSVGKSSILTRYLDNEYTEKTFNTIGVDFKFKDYVVNKKKVRLQIWDTSGQERFNTLTRQFYKGAHGALVVYDVTNQKSLEGVDGWLAQVESNSSDDIVNFVVGNKIDNESLRQVAKEDGQEYSDNRCCNFCEVSAKTGQNVDYLFSLLTAKMMENQTGEKINYSRLSKNTSEPEPVTGCQC